MQLLSVWIDSLKLLKPKIFTLFTGAVLLAGTRTYKVWFSKWWWLMLLLLSSLFYYGDCGGEFTLVGVLQRLTYMVLMSLAYISARPSISLKNYRYFYEHRVHILWMIPLFIAVDYIFSWFMMNDRRYFVAGLWFIIWFLVIINIRFTALFVADSSGSVQQALLSLLRSLRMTFFALPFLLMVILGLMTCLSAIIFGIALFIPNLVNDIELLEIHAYYLLILSVILMPFSAAFFATLYVKRLYDNSALYLE